MIVATYTSATRRVAPAPAQPLPMAHQVYPGTRPSVLPSASMPTWVQPFLDMTFTTPGAKLCWERILGLVLPEPTVGDVVVRVTLEGLKAFLDYEEPDHPFQVLRRLLPTQPCYSDIDGFDPLAQVSKRAPIETSGSPSGSVITGFSQQPSNEASTKKRETPIMTERS
ncbi:hypothetical protein PPTG_12591 [Phytophthora nicotianae INRA-310]|uniref:Uncharacterized protein n=1 Tax=Phytophthora nicotianae (strain INRA-310) TaxID=761204 RepID=W2PZU0_PHYN3|nr:hypothetical protein PPTG_12591 [Phytophthora nicotianae INRA-310]ETN06468.1 hypothetical protein PPTG_12591 [Phytophthora nicotianae INRA-310]